MLITPVRLSGVWPAMELGPDSRRQDFGQHQLAGLPQHPLHLLLAHTRIAAGTGERDRRMAERQLGEIAVELRCQVDIKLRRMAG